MFKSFKEIIQCVIIGVAFVIVCILGKAIFQIVTASPSQIQKIENLPEFQYNQDFSDNENSALIQLVNENGVFCSGTVISDNYVLTAAHCLIDSNGYMKKSTFIIRGINLITNEIIDIESQAAALNNRADYALVLGNFKKFTKMQILLNPQYDLMVTGVKGNLITCGSPWGSGYVCYLASTKIVKETNFLKTLGNLYPAMSGGAAIDTGRNLVVAINTAMGENSTIILAPLIGLFETLGIKTK